MSRARCASLLLVALISTSCATDTWTGDAASPTVAVVGDSLVFQSERSTFDSTDTLITDALVAAGTRAWVTGRIGLTVAAAYPDGVWTDPSREGVIPDVLIIALGTNDVRVDATTGLPRTTPEAARPLVRAWIAEAPDACIRLIGPAESITGWGLDATAPAWNVMLSEEAAIHGGAEYVAWEPDGAWTDGGADPHMTVAGRAAYRALIVAEAAACLA